MRDQLPTGFKALPGIIDSAIVFGSSEPINEEQLQAMHELHNISIIYNLLENPNEKLKKFWNDTFEGCEYITEINAVPTAIEDFGAPTQNQLDLITNDIIKYLESNKNILVHCRGGLGRTGTIFAALYMQLKNEHSAEKAIKYIRSSYSPHAVESRSQVQALVDFGNRIMEQINCDDPSFVANYLARSAARTSDKKIERS